VLHGVGQVAVVEKNASRALTEARGVDSAAVSAAAGGSAAVRIRGLPRCKVHTACDIHSGRRARAVPLRQEDIYRVRQTILQPDLRDMTSAVIGTDGP